MSDDDVWSVDEHGYVRFGEYTPQTPEAWWLPPELAASLRAALARTEPAVTTLNRFQLTGATDVEPQSPIVLALGAVSPEPARWWQAILCWAALGLLRLARLDTWHVTVESDRIIARRWNGPADGKREP